MHSRSKVFAIESISVMLVLILLAFVVVVLLSSGAHAYNRMLGDKKATESARVAYSYINMKVRQNDMAGRIDVMETALGRALAIDVEDGSYCNYIFYADGGLYECLTIDGGEPSVDAGNLIAKVSSFDVERDGARLIVRCTSGSGDTACAMEGVVSLRT
jgi:hypothetical protein